MRLGPCMYAHAYVCACAYACTCTATITTTISIAIRYVGKHSVCTTSTGVYNWAWHGVARICSVGHLCAVNRLGLHRQPFHATVRLHIHASTHQCIYASLVLVVRPFLCEKFHDPPRLCKQVAPEERACANSALQRQHSRPPARHSAAGGAARPLHLARVRRGPVPAHAGGASLRTSG